MPEDYASTISVMQTAAPNGEKTMRLSEAIRLGAMLKPQYFGDFYGPEQTTCALGAAGDAIGTVFIDQEDVAAEWPWTQGDFVRCPGELECGECGNVLNTIPHLNDDHRWTRERIADWVARHEPASVAAVVRAAGDVTDIADARSPTVEHSHGGDRD
jgi:hypothetical protein